MGITRRIVNIPGNAKTVTTVTTAQVLQALAGATVGAVGSLAFLYPISATTVAPGGTLTGAQLAYGPNSTGTSSPSGTWRLLGNLSSSGASALWLRIS
jgi:hypothetical protein